MSQYCNITNVANNSKIFCIMCDGGLKKVKRNGPYVNHTICYYERDSEFNEIWDNVFSLISLSREGDFVEANKSFCLFIRGFVWRLIQSSFFFVLFFIFYLSDDDDNIEKSLLECQHSLFPSSFSSWVSVCYKDTKYGIFF